MTETVVTDGFNLCLYLHLHHLFRLSLTKCELKDNQLQHIIKTSLVFSSYLDPTIVGLQKTKHPFLL